MATCVVFSGGPVRDPEALRPLIPEGAFMIAADAGYRLAAALGIRPDLLVGDFDSLEVLPDDVELVRLPAEKDETDTLAAVNLALGAGYDRFLILGAWGGFRRRIVTSMLGVILMGVTNVMLGLAPSTAYLLAVVSLLLMGFTFPMINGPFDAIIQSRVEPQKQGRVLSLVTSAATAMMPLSLAIAGPLSDVIGVRAWYVGGGVLCAVIGVVSFLLPAVMYVEDHDRAAGGASDAQPATALGYSSSPSRR